MKNSLKAESFKFAHQRIAPLGILILVLLMSYSALTNQIDPVQIIFEFGAVQWIPIIIIAVSSAFFAMEYQYNTILMLLYKQTSKWEIYISKLIVIWLYSVVLIIIAALYTFLLKTILANDQYLWSMAIYKQQTLLGLTINSIWGTLIYSLFIITLAFLLIIIIKLNAVVISIGLIFGFLGAGISIAFMNTFKHLIGVIRWNPLNMIFITQQLANPPYIKVSHLNNKEIIIGTLLYAVIFTVIGYKLFKKRRI